MYRQLYCFVFILIGSLTLNGVGADPQLPYYVRESILKKDALSGNLPMGYGFPYDIGAAPKPENSTAPEVKVGINVFKLKELNIATSQMSLNVWLRIQWTDPRLAWNTSESKYLGITQTTYKASTNLELTQIWVPDLELYNQAESVSNFAEKEAIVYSDGTVFWSRVGILEALCTISGLRKYPFDKIECTVDFGGWSHASLYSNYTFMNEPITYGGEGIMSSNSTYQEYGILEEVRTSRANHEYPCCPDPFPILSFTFVFKRKTNRYYHRSLILMMILFTFLASTAFFFDVRCGERLGFGITIMLAMVTTEVVTAEKLPTCPEVLWIEAITFGSTCFALLCLLESCLVTYIYFRHDDNTMNNLSKGVSGDSNAALNANDKIIGNDDADRGADRIKILRERKAELIEQKEKILENSYSRYSSLENNDQQENPKLSPESDNSKILMDSLDDDNGIRAGDYYDEEMGKNDVKVRFSLQEEIPSNIINYEKEYHRLSSVLNNITRKRCSTITSGTPRFSLFSAISGAQSWVEGNNLNPESLELVKKIDRISFKIFIALYPLYIIALYSSLPFWNDTYAKRDHDTDL